MHANLQKGTRNLSILKRIQTFLKAENLTDIYMPTVEPYFTYCCIIWDSTSKTQIVDIKNLQKLQNRALRIITGALYLQRSNVLCELGWMTQNNEKIQKSILMFKKLNGLTPLYLCEMFIHSASFPQKSHKCLQKQFSFTEEKSGTICQTV